jgi:hypothetical protein
LADKVGKADKFSPEDDLGRDVGGDEKENEGKKSIDIKITRFRKRHSPAFRIDPRHFYHIILTV